MEVKQSDFDYKTMIDHNSIKPFIFFVNNLQQKLSSINLNCIKNTPNYSRRFNKYKKNKK